MNCSYVQHGRQGRKTSGVPPRLMLAIHNFYSIFKLRNGTPLTCHIVFNFLKAEFGEGNRAY